MSTGQRLRVATYNIHKCRGMDARVDPDRIVDVLRALDADVIALQEVTGFGPGGDHAAHIAMALGMQSSLGENRRYRGSAYGNVVLSRVAPRAVRNFDITVTGREPRGCLRVDLPLGDHLLHIFNVHLGTSRRERRRQAPLLVSPEILVAPELMGARILLGDFNEWVAGPATRLMRSHLRSADIAMHLGRRRTYPGLLPLVHLDHVYYDPVLHLATLDMPTDRRARLASDHLPLVAEFDF